MVSGQGVAGIAQWIRRKGIVPRPGVTALQLPWLIARKIARDGTKAQPTREQAKTSQEPRIHELVRSEEHTSELQSLMRISYAVFCLKKKKKNKIQTTL